MDDCPVQDVSIWSRSLESVISKANAKFLLVINQRLFLFNVLCFLSLRFSFNSFFFWHRFNCVTWAKYTGTGVAISLFHIIGKPNWICKTSRPRLVCPLARSGITTLKLQSNARLAAHHHLLDGSFATIFKILQIHLT